MHHRPGFDNNFRQYGANFGGPVFKDKVFFFFSYEGLHSNNVSTSAPTFVETPDFRSAVIAQRAGSIAATILSQKGVEPRIASVLTLLARWMRGSAIRLCASPRALDWISAR